MAHLAGPIFLSTGTGLLCAPLNAILRASMARSIEVIRVQRRAAGAKGVHRLPQAPVPRLPAVGSLVRPGHADAAAAAPPLLPAGARRLLPGPRGGPHPGPGLRGEEPQLHRPARESRAPTSTFSTWRRTPRRPKRCYGACRNGPGSRVWGCCAGPMLLGGRFGQRHPGRGLRAPGGHDHDALQLSLLPAPPGRPGIPQARGPVLHGPAAGHLPPAGARATRRPRRCWPGGASGCCASAASAS